MQTVPEIPRCLGMFPPKYATYLISLFGLSSGGVGLGAVVLYGLVEDSIVAHFLKSAKTDGEMKKVALLIIGLTSLFLFISNFLLFLGAAFKSTGCLTTGAWLIMIMCTIIIIAAIGIPVSCFFIPQSCIAKKMSSNMFFLIYVGITLFLWVWLYFMTVAFNHLNEL